MSERKPFEVEVERKSYQMVTVYAEDLVDALEIAQDAANDGILSVAAPEQMMTGGKEPRNEVEYAGGYENGDVCILVGPIENDSISTYPND